MNLACCFFRFVIARESPLRKALSDLIEDVEGNERCWMSLHLATHCSNSSSALIEKLVELNPAAATCVDRNGCCALHLACDAGKKWERGLETLFNANPSSLASADRHGLLPPQLPQGLPNVHDLFCCCFGSNKL